MEPNDRDRWNRISNELGLGWVIRDFAFTDCSTHLRKSNFMKILYYQSRTYGRKREILENSGWLIEDPRPGHLYTYVDALLTTCIHSHT